MAEIVWSKQARADLLDIYVSIGIENPTAAEKYFDLIEAKAAMLASHPRLGVRRPEISPSARGWSQRPT